MIKFKAEIIVDFCQGTFLEDEDCFRKMDASNIIFISGVVVACIWLGASILCDGKARTYVNLFGVLIDVILFIICQKIDFLAVGVIGGLICGIFPIMRPYKYQKAVKEFQGVWKWTIVLVIFFVMIFMVIAVANPNVTLEW